MYKRLMFFDKFTLFLVITLILNVVSSSSNKDALRQTKFPPCKACKTFIESFIRGMEKTEKGKFEGGDAAWEEEKLKSYSNSEIRLVEIQEHLCSDVEEGRDQCYTLNEQYETTLETWWFNHKNDHPDLYSYFCITQIESCCPDKHYGPKCLPCEGYPDNICGNNGRCKGAGTRKGNGQCACDKGYSGVNCDTCADKHFEAYRDDKKVLCTACHAACDGNCTKAGTKGCTSCTVGYIMDPEKGCLDLNECAGKKSPCTSQEFCVNSEGSFKCLACDKSCNGCSGDGPDSCTRCIDGYVLKDGMCVDAEQETRERYIYMTRYATYFGLCVATCIIFQRSVLLAAVIGLAVAVYISLSEYFLKSAPTPNTNDLAEQILKAATEFN